MELRLIIAYGLMLAVTLCLAAVVAHRIRHSPARSYLRRKRRERRTYEAREGPLRR